MKNYTFERNEKVKWSVFANHFFVSTMSPSQSKKDFLSKIDVDGKTCKVNSENCLWNFYEEQGLIGKESGYNYVFKPHELADAILAFFTKGKGLNHKSAKRITPDAMSDSMKTFLGIETEKQKLQRELLEKQKEVKKQIAAKAAKEIEEKKKETSNLTTLVIAKENLVKDLTEEVNSLEAKLKALEKEKESELANISEKAKNALEDAENKHKEEILVWQGKVSSLEEIRSADEAKFNQLLISSQTFKNEAEDLTEKNIQLTNKLSNLSDRYEALSRILEEKSAAIEVLEKKVSGLSARNIALSRELNGEKGLYERSEILFNEKLEEFKAHAADIRQGKIEKIINDYISSLTATSSQVYEHRVNNFAKKWRSFLSKFGDRFTLGFLILLVVSIGALEGYIQGNLVSRYLTMIVVHVGAVISILFSYRSMIRRDFSEVIDTLKLPWASFREKKDDDEAICLYNKNRKIQKLIKDIGDFKMMPNVIWVYDIASMIITAIYYARHESSVLRQIATGIDGQIDYWVLIPVSILIAILLTLSIHMLIYGYGKVYLSYLSLLNNNKKSLKNA